MVKKGDERRERKKVVASNTKRGLIDEPISKDDQDPEHSFDDSQDLNFQPSS